ncbi:hypothetical protein [Aureimonas mangrovi]|uniref:hypothetical protein n=1 Tax=Aureimonas mangrovi TaxID=2758041 RepID=UPI00163DB648|nr:hypothetical protein [Aureimonas mangrovi]
MARNDKDAPHIRAGEWVVVDPNDREAVKGELFLVQWSGGRRSVMQTTSRIVERCWNSRGEEFRNKEFWTLRSIGHALSLSDGPLHPDHLRDIIVGRVIGLFEPTFDEASLKVIGRPA